MEHDIFISYAHKDESIAEAICGKLESANLTCWTAARDLSAREDWTEATRNAIASSQVIVLLLSENANASPHIEREMAHAFYTRRIIVPFRLAETLPRREILFYLGNVSWVNALHPPTEEDLDALIAHIRELIPGAAGARNAAPPQIERKQTAPVVFSSSWSGALETDRTPEILKWVGLTTFLCAVVLFLWFAVRQTKEWATLAESHRQSADPVFSVAPTASPENAGDALESKKPSTFSRFGSWQAVNGSPTPLIQESQDPSPSTPSEQSANATSSPPATVTPGERSEGLDSEPRPRHLPSAIHRLSHDHEEGYNQRTSARPPHHPQFPGTQVKEARRIADLENQRDSLRSQLKDTEANVLARQKNADLVTNQRDALQTRLSESEEKRLIVQKNADLMARELAQLRDQLKEAENRALTAQRNEELVRVQRDALQARLEEAEAEAQAAQKNADLAIRQRDALQSEIGEVRERAQLAEANASLAVSQRDAMAAELKKKNQQEPPDKKAQLNQPGADLAELPDSAPDTQFQEVRLDAQPAHQNPEFAQTQPPNPGQNAKPAPLTQSLDSSVQPTGPSKD
jgi:hypothetical protein